MDCQLSYPHRFGMMFGRDEMMLMGLAAGAKTFVGSTYNFAIPLYLKIWEAFNRNDFENARRLQHQAIKMIQILNAFGGGTRFGKMVVKLIGMDCGPVRLPIKPFSDQELEAAKKAIGSNRIF